MRRDPSIDIQSFLDPGEYLLWSGRPRQGIVFRGIDAFLIPFGLLWGGFAVFWEYTVLGMTKKSMPFFPLFGVPFVLIGLYMVFGRFFVDALIRKKTSYGVTSERIVILSGLVQRRVKSLNLKNLTDTSFNEKKDGSGTINFGPAFPFGSGFPTGPLLGGHQIRGARFEGIENVRTVYGTIRDAQEKASK